MSLHAGVRFGLWLGALAGVAAVLMRPARLQSARVTSVTGEAPPTAGVVLHYSLGKRPSSVIVDVSSGSATGSATVGGDQTYVKVMLATGQGREPRPPHTYCVTTTAMYRVFGRLLTITQAFDLVPSGYFRRRLRSRRASRRALGMGRESG